MEKSPISKRHVRSLRSRSQSQVLIQQQEITLNVHEEADESLPRNSVIDIFTGTNLTQVSARVWIEFQLDVSSEYLCDVCSVVHVLPELWRFLCPRRFHSEK